MIDKLGKIEPDTIINRRGQVLEDRDVICRDGEVRGLVVEEQSVSVGLPGGGAWREVRGDCGRLGRQDCGGCVRERETGEDPVDQGCVGLCGDIVGLDAEVHHHDDVGSCVRAGA